MTLESVKEILQAEVLVLPEKLSREVGCACGSDLMSDVLAFSREKGVLLTGLVNPQVIRTAEMMDIKAVCFVRGKTPGVDIQRMAEEKSIVIMTTKHPLYISCGLLYSNGLGGAED